MAVEQDDHVRLKIVDFGGDALFTHGVEPDGSIVITIWDHKEDRYAAVLLRPEERAALVARISP